jgi:RimJ/RimL family protein N-acetyltransferase
VHTPSRYGIEWKVGGDGLRAIEPTAVEVGAVTRELAAAYNDEHNAPLMGHSETMDEHDVSEHFAVLAREGARAFLLYRDGVLAGDADVRSIANGGAEFAIMIGARAAQGRGLGTRFALMLHAFAFRHLELERLFVAIVPENKASRRLFEKLGYVTDTSPEARAHVDSDDEITMSITRGVFERAHAHAVAGIVWSARE